MGTLARFRRAWWGIRQEIAWGWRHVTQGRTSYFVSVLAYRVLAVLPTFPGANAVHRLETSSGLAIFYRRNRGDVQGIREIFIDEIYRLPEGAAPASLVDFGANIGLATLWLAHEYRIGTVVALEPIPENFDLLERNCRANGIAARLVKSAIGTTSGTTTFDLGAESNLGRVGQGDLVVELIGINELMASLSFSGALLKIDVEGMERPLLEEVDPQWIHSFELVVMEMHPQYFDIAPLIEIIEKVGFRYYEPVEVSHGTMRSKRERLFVRADSTLTR